MTWLYQVSAEQAGRVAQHAFEDAAPAAADGALAELRRSRRRCSPPRRPAAPAIVAHAAPILVAKRQVVEQILDRLDAELAQLLGAARADVLGELHRLRPARSSAASTSPLLRRYVGVGLAAAAARTRSTSARQTAAQRASALRRRGASSSCSRRSHSASRRSRCGAGERACAAARPRAASSRPGSCVRAARRGGAAARNSSGAAPRRGTQPAGRLPPGRPSARAARAIIRTPPAASRGRRVERMPRSTRAAGHQLRARARGTPAASAPSSASSLQILDALGGGGGAGDGGEVRHPALERGAAQRERVLVRAAALRRVDDELDLRRRGWRRRRAGCRPATLLIVVDRHARARAGTPPCRAWRPARSPQRASRCATGTSAALSASCTLRNTVPVERQHACRRRAAPWRRRRRTTRRCPSPRRSTSSPDRAACRRRGTWRTGTPPPSPQMCGGTISSVKPEVGELLARP